MRTKINRTLVMNAYRKLKSFAYFDKTQSLLKQRIVDFESQHKIVADVLDDFTDTIQKVISENNQNNNDNEISNMIANNINVRLFPKKIERYETNDYIKSNVEFNEKVVVNKTQAFFDAPISIHLLGVIWTMLVGTQIDETFGPHIYGNRIKENFRGEKSAIGSSPYLLKPYFEQYETWRNNAINILESELNNKKELLMINLDLKRYFYQVNLNETKFIKDMKSYVENEEQLNLSRIIYRVMETYSKELRSLDIEISSGTVLPIGFFPSTILSNYYLLDFDKAIINSKAIYYGRYVDDILIIYTATENSFVKQLLKQKPEAPKVERNVINLVKILNDLYCKHMINKNKPWFLERDSENHAISFQVGEKKLLFNANKINFSFFDSNHTTAMIEDFKLKIWENKSEFRLVPEDIYNLDYSKILNEPDSKENVPKIKGLALDKFEFSKFLGKHLHIVKNIKVTKTNKTYEDIIKILDKSNLIDIYLMWESLFTLFILAKQNKLLSQLLDKIWDSIKDISIEGDFKKINIKSFLTDHFRTSLYRAGSLIQHSKSFKYWDTPLNIKLDLEQFDNFRYYNMTNKIYLGTIPSLITKNIKKFTRYYELHHLIESIDYESDFFKNLRGKEIKRNEDYYLLPYNVSLTDLQVLRLFRRVNENNGFSIEEQTPNNFVDILSDYWLPVNGINPISGRSNAEKIFNDKILMHDIINTDKDKCKDDIPKHGKRLFTYDEDENYDKAFIGVGNVRINNSDTYFDSIRNDTQDRSLERYNNLKEALNTAIRFERISNNKTNLFILPEAFVPFDWLNLLVSTAKKNDMAIISGLEHIKIKGKYYNFLVSIFPVTVKNFTMVNINFHLKVHYAPIEVEEFGEHNLVSGNIYEMHKWRGINIAPYYCYELTSIYDRVLFKEDNVNLIAASVFNRDVQYFSNIIETMGRELDSFVVQANDSSFGDSRIFQPAKSHYKHVMRVSGGLNHTALISEINIKSLMDHLKRPLSKQMQDKYWKIGSIK